MEFHLLSFEGPDPYSRAGGLASRIDGLSRTLAELDHETHLWFVGSPDAPGHEADGNLHLHRWCQWISRHHPSGVYDGEEGKHRDYSASLPPWLCDHLRRKLRAGERAVILAEEWQTVDAVLHLDALLRRDGLRDQVTILWNANNTFGFERVDFGQLASAATITTVSRYMKHWMKNVGVEALAIPNGLTSDAFDTPAKDQVAALRGRCQDRTLLFKMARFDPDKRWLLAIETVAEMKRLGLRPLLLARGGQEAHGVDVRSSIRAHGLSMAERSDDGRGIAGIVDAVTDVAQTDVVFLRSSVGPAERRVLLRGADAVLANSGHEPFGLVGLETMAAGGLACTGYSGEDYADPNRNALVLQTGEASEFVSLYTSLKQDPARERALRRAGRQTAEHYAWPQVIARHLLPRIELSATA